VGVPSPIWLGVPLKIDHKTLGVLAVQSYDTGSLYGPRDLDLLSFVAGNIALVVERKRSEVELRQSEKRFRDLFEASPD
ncbi:MAG: GAF domain-containing protein, partial [Acidobacteria bacterium]|nr:GAF domain-containing protein [Acidobacteriota bacterium]